MARGIVMSQRAVMMSRSKKGQSHDVICGTSSNSRLRENAYQVVEHNIHLSEDEAVSFGYAIVQFVVLTL